MKPLRAFHVATLCITTVLLSGCATDRPISFTCQRMGDFRIAVEPTPAGSIPAVATPTLQSVFKQSMGRQQAGAVQTSGSDILVLSGGGKWGAYGAGLLDGWSRQTDPQNQRPEFAIVTGVSTGALQSTFAFIGQEADQSLVAAYEIERERQLAIRHGKLFFLRHASMADLSPLRSYAAERLAPWLDKVAGQAARGRKLLIGTIDALDGKMYAIDMTRIASELSGRERLDCYVGALLASAAIPVVFRQVTINKTPYFDAGVRHSVFLSGVQTAAARAASEAERPSKLYILLNGVPGAGMAAAVPAKLLPTMGRLRALTFDQIEQDSVYAVAQQSPGLATVVATAEGHGCEGAGQDEDIFNPALMKCLVRAGRDRWRNGTPWKAYASR